jgi:hypothetical protein
MKSIAQKNHCETTFESTSVVFVHSFHTIVQLGELLSVVSMSRIKPQ